MMPVLSHGVDPSSPEVSCNRESGAQNAPPTTRPVASPSAGAR